jgi:hypothetical protein
MLDPRGTADALLTRYPHMPLAALRRRSDDFVQEVERPGNREQLTPKIDIESG